jgi:DNA invertase Pin-like site-specific DNA recombinase
MIVGYVRVSTLDQNVDRQIEILQEAGVEKIFQEKVSGKDTNRPQLQEMLKYLREGDTLIVESFSRLARNTRDLLNIVEELSKNKVKFVSKKETIDTDTVAGKFMLTVFAGISELERGYLKERQMEGIRIAQKKGKYKGRPPIPEDKWNELWELVKIGDLTKKGMARRLGINVSYLYTLVNKRKKLAEKKLNEEQNNL